MIILSLSLILSIGIDSFSQNGAQDRAMYLFNICYGVTWENEKDIEKITMAVLSDDEEFTALKKLAESRVIGGKPVEVTKYENHEDIKEHHVIYITQSENAYLAFIYEKFNGKNVLIVSDRSKEPQYSVINFRDFKEGLKKFDINKILADEQKLKLSNQILKLGGNREVLQELYSEKNKKYMECEKKIKKLEKELKEKDELIKELIKKLEEE